MYNEIWYKKYNENKILQMIKIWQNMELKTYLQDNLQIKVLTVYIF